MDKERKARLEALLAEATVDSYNEDEAFWGVFTTLDDNLKFPLRARALGDDVTLVRLDEKRSGLGRGIIARIRKGDREYSTSLDSLEIIDPDPVSAEWLAVYRYWGGDHDGDWVG